MKKADGDYVFNSKKYLSKGIFVDKEYSSTTEAERKRPNPVLRAVRRLEEYRGKCKMEGMELIIKGKKIIIICTHFTVLLCVTTVGSFTVRPWGFP